MTRERQIMHCYDKALRIIREYVNSCDGAVNHAEIDKLVDYACERDIEVYFDKNGLPYCVEDCVIYYEGGELE